MQETVAVRDEEGNDILRRVPKAGMIQDAVFL